jgi:hypothetical protein
VGEIGISRHEFYYELRWWEVKAIIRGYNARHHHSWEQARLVAYNAHFCMGSKNPIPMVTEWIKFPWEKEETKSLTKEEQDDLLADIAAENARIAESQK